MAKFKRFDPKNKKARQDKIRSGSQKKIKLQKRHYEQLYDMPEEYDTTF